MDLGTANTVLAVVDSTNRPIAGVSAPSHAIRDGVIVNYYESVQLVTKLKEELEEKLGTELLYAAAAIPPGVSEGSVKSIGYVLEGAGFEVTNIVDEPTAAAAVLKITDGAVVDVGGGTTGISILKDGKVIYTCLLYTSGAIILPGVTIGDNVVIGAGSIVTKSIPDNVIAAGSPCRVIRRNQ